MVFVNKKYLCFSFKLHYPNPYKSAMIDRSTVELSKSCLTFQRAHLFKRIIHDNGFTEEDYRRYRPVIFSNAIMSLIAILRAMEKLHIPFGEEKRIVSSALSFQFFCRFSVSSTRSAQQVCIKCLSQGRMNLDG